MFIPMLSLVQTSKREIKKQKGSEFQIHAKYIAESHPFTLEGDLELTNRAWVAAIYLNKDVNIALLDASGQVIMLTRGNGVELYNTEASKRKAYTSLSTKTCTLLLGHNTKANADTQNLANLPELLMLGGGYPSGITGK